MQCSWLTDSWRLLFMLLPHSFCTGHHVMSTNPIQIYPNQSLRCDYPAVIFGASTSSWFPHSELIIWSSRRSLLLHIPSRFMLYATASDCVLDNVIHEFHHLCELILVQKQTRWQRRRFWISRYVHTLQHSIVCVFILRRSHIPKKNCHAVQRARAMERIPIGITGMAWLSQILIVFSYPLFSQVLPLYMPEKANSKETQIC